MNINPIFILHVLIGPIYMYTHVSLGVYFLLTRVCSHLYKLQVWTRSDWVVWYVDLQEGVELVVAAAKSRGDGVDTITPVQGVWVVESKRPRRRFILWKEVMWEVNAFKPPQKHERPSLSKEQYKIRNIEVFLMILRYRRYQSCLAAGYFSLRLVWSH